MSVAEKFEKTNIEDILPLTPMQESMLFQYLNHPDTEQYFEQLCLALQGRINSVIFRRAWNLVADANEALRTVFRWDKLEHPVQLVLKNRELPIREYDFSDMQQSGKAVYFTGVFPVSAVTDSRITAKLEELYGRWQQEAEEFTNTYVIDFRGVAGLYHIQAIFDPVKDSMGHLPFSDEYYAAMGTAIARKLLSWKQQQFKVIVLDCDNTLWQGICGEAGALEVKVEAPYRALQQFVLQKQREGMLLVLCSKNNEADVREVLAKNPGMILKQTDLAGWRINWRPKSENLKELAGELNLGLESFILIDDSPLECAEVMANCPQVLALRLPEEARLFPGYLKHVWAFDRLKVTTEDRQRTQMYREEKERQEIQKESLTLDDFIKNLGIKVSLNVMDPSQANRVAQLTQRTNQFNLSTIRRTEAEIEAIIMLRNLRGA
jgi:FkbH-like protein